MLTALPTVSSFDTALSGAEGIVAGSHPGLTLVEMRTFPLEIKDRGRKALSDDGAAMLDAPVSGDRSPGRISRHRHLRQVEKPTLSTGFTPIFAAISKATFNLGEFGNGSKMEFAANLLVSVHNLATAEAFVLRMKAGLAPQQVLEVISAGVGSSRIFEIRGPMIAGDDYSPAAKLKMLIKEIDVIGEFGRAVGSPTPLLDASLPWYEEAVDVGLGDLDAAALARLLEVRAGLRRERP